MRGGGGGRELSGVGALTISICRRVCHGVRGGHGGDGPGFGARSVMECGVAMEGMVLVSVRGLSWSAGWPWRGWSWFRCEVCHGVRGGHGGDGPGFGAGSVMECGVAMEGMVLVSVRGLSWSAGWSWRGWSWFRCEVCHGVRGGHGGDGPGFGAGSVMECGVAMEGMVLVSVRGLSWSAGWPWRGWSWFRCGVCHGVRGGHGGDGPGFGARSVMECGVAMEGMVLVSVRGLSWSAGWPWRGWSWFRCEVCHGVRGGHGGDGPGFGARSVMECGVAMEGMVLVSVRGLSWSAGWPWRGWSWFRCEVCHGVRGGHGGDGPGFGAGSVMECGVAMEGMVLVSVRGLSWSAGWPWRGWSWFRCGVCHGVRGGHGGDGPGFGARSVMECGVAMEGMVLVSVRGLSWSAGWPWRGWSWFRCEVCHGVRGGHGGDGPGFGARSVMECGVAMEGMILVSVRGLSWSAGWPWRGWSWFRCGVCHGVRGGHGGDGPGFGVGSVMECGVAMEGMVLVSVRGLSWSAGWPWRGWSWFRCGVCHGVRGGHGGNGPGFGAGSVMECGVAMEGMVLVSVRGLSWSAGWPWREWSWFRCGVCHGVRGGHGGYGPGFGARSVMECGVAMEGMVLVSVRGLSWSAGWPWRGWSWFRCEVCHGVRGSHGGDGPGFGAGSVMECGVAMEGMVLVSVRGLSWSAGWPWRGWSWFRCEVCHGVRGGHGGDGPGFGASLARGTSCGQSSNSLQ